MSRKRRNKIHLGRSTRFEQLEGRRLLSSVPMLTSSSLLGGTDREWNVVTASDAAGNSYLAGITSSTDFPTKDGPGWTNYDKRTNIPTGFLAKFRPPADGVGESTVEWIRLLGSDGVDSRNQDIFVENTEEGAFVYLVGEAFGSDFLETDRGFDQSLDSGSNVPYLTKLDEDGRIVYDTFLGGSPIDGWGVDVDAVDGVAYVGGGVDGDALVTAVNTNASDKADQELFLYTFDLGGRESVLGLATDAAGNTFAAGTNSRNGKDFLLGLDINGNELFPPQSFSSPGNARDLQLVSSRTDDTTGDLESARVLIGTDELRAMDIDMSAAATEKVTEAFKIRFRSQVMHLQVDNMGNAYVVGRTNNSFLDTSNVIEANGDEDFDGARHRGDFDGMYASFSGVDGDNPQQESLSYIGAAGFDNAFRIAVVKRNDHQGVNLYIAGHTESRDFPAINSVEDASINYDGSLYAGGSSDAFIMTVELTRPIPGDANGDGVFTADDLIEAFSAGKYLTDEFGEASFQEGDWDQDGDFDSDDLLFAFAEGHYESGQRAALRDIAAAVELAFAADDEQRSPYVA